MLAWYRSKDYGIKPAHIPRLSIPFSFVFEIIAQSCQPIPTSSVDIKINLSHKPYHLGFFNKKKDVYQIITDLIIEKLEQGTIPWKQPWNNYSQAQNYISRKPYRGINQLILNVMHANPFYLTFKQAISLGGRIKKASKSLPVTYWNFTYRDKESGRKLTSAEALYRPSSEVSRTAFLKYYRVFILLLIPPTITKKNSLQKSELSSSMALQAF